MQIGEIILTFIIVGNDNYNI